MHDFTTIELKLNVFGAAVDGDELICEARPLHVGRSTAVIEAKIRIGDKPVANLIVTQFVLPGRDPRAERPAPGDYPPGERRRCRCCRRSRPDRTPPPRRLRRACSPLA